MAVLSLSLSRVRRSAHPFGERLRHAAGMWREWREWFVPVAVAGVLTAVMGSGAFAMLDARFFDHVVEARPGIAPTVVVIERDDPDLASLPDLEQALAKLGVERIGHLEDDRDPVAMAPSSVPVPVIVGVPASPSAGHGYWQFDRPAERLGRAKPFALTSAPSKSGVTRTQYTGIPMRGAWQPTFDAALAELAPAGEVLVPLSRRQTVPVLLASQIVAQQLRPGDLDSMVALVAPTRALQPTLATPLHPDRMTSEAMFRAYTIHALRTGTATTSLAVWQGGLVLVALAALLILAYRRFDPKRHALLLPAALTLAILAISWLGIVHAAVLLPVTAMVAMVWSATFSAIVMRETVQDHLLAQSATQAAQASLTRSPLRESSRLPDFLGQAADHAGIERSALLRYRGGRIEPVAGSAALSDTIDASPKRLVPILKRARRSGAMVDASVIAPDWNQAQIAFLGSDSAEWYWLHGSVQDDLARPHIVEAISASARELFDWRRGLNLDAQRTIDAKVTSAIGLVAREAAQIRRGVDIIDTAVVVFHLIGTPLHANSAMEAIYREAGLDPYATSLTDALLALTDLERDRVRALVEDLMIDGTEMRVPMRSFDKSSNERLLRIAAPQSEDASGDRVLVIEAVDMRAANRMADMRGAVAKFIDLQLRNDFEAIMLAGQLAADERLGPGQLRSVVGQIADTARRATDRLDEVATLIRTDPRELVEACYPIDAAKTVREAVRQARPLAEELGVTIAFDHPGISGFTLAEPAALRELVLAMLRVVVSDTPQGGSVACTIREQIGHTRIAISGGFGIGFGRLLALVSNYEQAGAGEYRVIGEGIAAVTRWSASVSYWGSEANGFGFNIDLKGLS